ncbi:tetratricopeptide repeat protein [Marivirga sp. S37H4]|uniref:Tetratricopeptide repeat protein n=1 Tax=Marivirga aurantiaca TaxID=2802615 RepID=A0A934WXX2_9BACT|nr:tetratricopeptide repeat protein [Marivirga aurantiaca]MBK6264907.1 tetratricopeptide repeat protein [Marivirga aurantiaca]
MNNISKVSFAIVMVLMTVDFAYAQKTAADFIDHGTKKYEEKEYMEAIVSLNEAIALDKSSYQAYYMRGNIKQKFADVHGAMKDYNSAVDANPEFPEAYFERGNIKYLLQDYYGAINDYTKTIELNENNLDALYKRGQAKQQLEAYQDAINDCTQILNKDPKNVDAFFLRGVLRIEYGQLSEGCLDLSKAGELGDLKAYEMIRERCNDARCYPTEF